MLFSIIIWTVLIGLIGVGGAFLSLRLFLKSSSRLLLIVSFAAGALVGVSFLELLPEALEEGAEAGNLLSFVLLGFVIFYLVSRLLVFHHCHSEHCQARASASLIIFGDTLHNFLDGLAVAASFLVGWPVGVMTSLAIIFHEIPQEVGDFGVLLHSGYSKTKAAAVNIVSAFFCILGGLVGFYFFEFFHGFLPYILALTAGGFLYIGAADLLPQTHHQIEKRQAILSHALMFLLGIIILWALGLVIKE